MAVIEDQARSLFLAALDRPPDQWAAFLDAACGGDAAVRARVDGLLAAHREMGSIHASPPADPAATADLATAERPGTVIGPYKLMEEIGEGGMGRVFVAEQARPVRRRVALKVIKPGMDSKQVLARFEAERQALALMDHPNIAKVFDGGATASGRPYFVMELVKGRPVTTYCDENYLTVRERLGLFADVCGAVQHAHQKGVIHRDIKPANVLVASLDGTPAVKVIDFGVAKAIGQPLTEQTVYTQFAQMIGTPLYMSPEQAGQSALDVDTRTDIYALGVLLYELLTGHTPFDGERLRTAGFDEFRRIIREEEPARPSTRISTLGLAAETVSANRRVEPTELRRLVRGELDWIVMKTLEKDRNRRYDTASTLAADVRRYLADEPVLAGPPSGSYRVRKFVRRNRRLVAAAAAVAVTLVGGIAGTTWGMLRAEAARADAADLAGQRETALGEKAAAFERAEDELFKALVNRTRAERSSGRTGQRFAALAAIREAAAIRVTPDLRAEAMAALLLPDLEVAHEWEAWPDGTVGVDFDAAFERYARLDNRGGIAVCRRVNGREEVEARCPPHGKPVFAGPWFSPDGGHVAYLHGAVPGGGRGEVRVLATPAAAAVDLDPPEAMYEKAIAFRADRRQVAIGHPNGGLSVYDLGTGQRVRRLDLGGPAYHLAFRPGDGRLAAAVGGEVRLYDVDDGKELPPLRHPPQDRATRGVGWHPDGHRLAAATSAGTIRVWDTRTAAEVMPALAEGSDGLSVAFHPAGDLLVCRGWGNRTSVWSTVAGRRLLATAGDYGDRFSRDGALLGGGVAGGRARLSRVTDGHELRTLRPRTAGQETFISAVLHPNGRTLAVGSHRWLQFFDVVSGEELVAARLPQSAAASPVFFDPPASSRPGEPDWKADRPDDEKAGGWVTGGYGGVLVWPTREDAARQATLLVGPPRHLAADPGGGYSFATGGSGDGRIVVIPQGQSALVLDRANPGWRKVLGPQTDVRFTAVSPDGRWVFTGSHWPDNRSRSARVWDGENDWQARELPLDGSTQGRFSPDGQWMLTATGAEARLWEVGTWREVRRLSGGGVFSPDGRLLALRDGANGVRLEETATGREVARLSGQQQAADVPAGFTPDGTRLVVQRTSDGTIGVWDLRLIRQQLKGLGLDWEWPVFPPAGPGEGAARLEVKVDLGDLGNPRLTREQRVRKGVVRLRQHLDKNPDDPRACNNLAWYYLTGPKSLRDVKAAVPLAERAVRLAPGDAVYANTLGAAYARSGQYGKAVEILRPNLTGQEDAGLAFDLYFLAICHHGLGEPGRARDYYDWAVRWSRTHPGRTADEVTELAEFRDEVERLLGVKPVK
jgi:serine/threonine protein kinase/WD40 repeat protein